jgi:hypothetical protein
VRVGGGHSVMLEEAGGCRSKPRPAATLRKHGQESVDLVSRAENCAFERAAVAFGASESELPDLGHLRRSSPPRPGTRWPQVVQATPSGKPERARPWRFWTCTAGAHISDELHSVIPLDAQAGCRLCFPNSQRIGGDDARTPEPRERGDARWR